MEKDMHIKTKDGHLVYGTLTSKKPSTKLLILCHGFTGNRNEHQFFNAARYFSSKGYDVFRFDFYCGEKKARHFEDTSLSIHGSDITDIINSFVKKYKKIYIAGHSFGGTSLLLADMSHVTAVVFWDASFVIADLEKQEFEKSKKNGQYYVDWGVKNLVGKKFVQELYAFPDCGELIKKIQKPVLFIGAQKAGPADAKKYFAAANNPKEITIIKGADHGFNTQDAEDQLFEQTLRWCKKY